MRTGCAPLTRAASTSARFFELNTGSRLAPLCFSLSSTHLSPETTRRPMPSFAAAAEVANSPPSPLGIAHRA